MVRRLPTAIGLALVLALTFTVGAVARPAPVSEAADASVTQLRAGQVDFRLVLGGLTGPLGVTHAGDGTNRMFVTQQNGIVRAVSASGQLVAGTFLDIRNVPGGFTTGGERGLLGLAFHPSFASNRKLYAFYTGGAGNLVIAEFTANAARTNVDISTRAVILDIPHPNFANHNGGQLAFGPDGNLFILTGDGGGAGDPNNNAQSLGTLLGKVLRIRVTGNGSYTIPAGNPFVGQPGRDEIWAYGLRNPWRASFDRANGNLWIADVGQGGYEEINRVAGSAAGRNYMWSRCEGRHLFKGPGPCDVTSGVMTAPIVEYSQPAPRSVVGGFVYRGARYPDLVGHYIYADFYSGRVWSVPAGGSTVTFHRQTSLRIASFGEGESGELYAVDLVAGRLYQVVGPPFSDIASSQFYGDIVWIADRGITSGCGGGRYCPEQVVNREQMASFIARALNLPAATRDFFTDDGGSIHQSDINRLAQAGIATGCGGGRYCPLAPLTRQEMASFIARAKKLPPATRDFFSDDTGSLHEADINRIAQAGITTGCGGGRFCPLQGLTRGEMAAFIHRAFP